MRFDVARGGGSEDFRVPRRLRPRGAAAAPQRRRAAGSWRSASARGRSTAGLRSRRGSTCGRATAAPSAGPSSTAPTACTRCTSTASCSACSSAAAGRVHAADRLGWKDTIGVLPNETVDRARLVRALQRPVRVPLPRARARRQGDDAAAGGGRDEGRSPSPACSPRSPSRPARAAERRRSRRSTTDAGEQQPLVAAGDVTIKVGETVTWRFDGTTLAHNVTSTSTNWTSARRRDSPGAYTFATPGTYAFVCKVHADTMVGTVTVTDASGTPPPPPPPPP